MRRGRPALAPAAQMICAAPASPRRLRSSDMTMPASEKRRSASADEAWIEKTERARSDRCGIALPCSAHHARQSRGTSVSMTTRMKVVSSESSRLPLVLRVDSSRPPFSWPCCTLATPNCSSEMRVSAKPLISVNSDTIVAASVLSSASVAELFFFFLAPPPPAAGISSGTALTPFMILQRPVVGSRKRASVRNFVRTWPFGATFAARMTMSLCRSSSQGSRPSLCSASSYTVTRPSCAQESSTREIVTTLLPCSDRLMRWISSSTFLALTSASKLPATSLFCSTH